ncbi:MAG: hypothetical protein QOC66_1245 [Pseudonocardiales bacterium]|jgi:hypothetical protein|nr:hypothetical protein [Pseudonocardiales bacterium]
MTERDPGGPTVEDELVNRVVAAGNRRRTRRSAWLIGGVLAVAAAVTVPLLVGAAGGRGPAVAGQTQAPPDTTAGSRVSANVGGQISDRAAIYAAALIHRSEPSTPAGVDVRDRICEKAITDPGTKCRDSAIPLSVRREIAQLMPYGVHFVAREPGALNGTAPPLIVFGALAITSGKRATLGIEMFCGPLCGDGKTLVLARTDDGWRVTGTTGPEWIS